MTPKKPPSQIFFLELQEGMVEQILATHSFVGVLLQEAVDEGDCLFGQVIRIVDGSFLHTHDPILRLLSSDMVEGCLAYQKFVGQHAQAPQIDSLVILLPTEYLRRCIIKGPTAGTTPVIADRSPTKITQFAHTLTIKYKKYMSENNVLRLDIPMRNGILMQVFDGRGDLFYFLGYFAFGEGFLLLQLREQGPLFHVLHDQVDVGGIVEAVVQGHNVLVMQECLDFQLQNQLVDHVQFLDILFWDFFHCEYGTGWLMEHLMYCPKSALAQELSHHKLIKEVDGGVSGASFADGGGTGSNLGTYWFFADFCGRGVDVRDVQQGF